MEELIKEKILAVLNDVIPPVWSCDVIINENVIKIFIKLSNRKQGGEQ